MSVDSMTNQTASQNLDKMPMESLAHSPISIENESELWHKTWDLYLNVARSRMTNDLKRQALLQLAESDSGCEGTICENHQTDENTTEDIISKLPITVPPTNKTALEEANSSTEYEITISPDIAPPHMIIIKPVAQDRIKHNSILVVLICLLFLMLFCFIISCWLEVRQILICICYIPCRLHRLIFTHSQNIHLPLMHKIEKLLLLDSMAQHSHLSTLFQDNLLVYSSIHDCFHHLASNHLQDYILFLSLTDFEVHSLKLKRLSNVSLGIFYEGNDPHLSKTKYHIRFIFPKACLLEYLRHAVILNYAKQAHTYRLEGLEREADEHYLVASRECHRLADELEQQSSAIGGREPEESISHDSEDMNDRYLR